MNVHPKCTIPGRGTYSSFGTLVLRLRHRDAVGGGAQVIPPCGPWAAATSRYAVLTKNKASSQGAERKQT
jgi:hypothetical protein